MIYLYEKLHLKTGLKYFGKTTQDPSSYLGSGVAWTRHLKEHGEQHVVNKNVWAFEIFDEAREFATQFSMDNDIVNSNEYANLIPEKLTGGDTSNTAAYIEGIKNRPSRKGIPLSEEAKQKLRKPKKSNKNYLHLRPPLHKGRIYINNGTEQLRVFPEDAQKHEGYTLGKLKKHCAKCDKWADKQNFARHHSNC